MLDGWIAGITGGELEAWQLARLRDVTAYARAHSAFYRDRLPETPVRSFDDFAALPFTTAEDLAHFHRQMLCVSPDDVARIVTLTTSGSTGAPKRIYFTAADQELTVDYFHHGMEQFVSPGDRVMILFPGTSPGSLNDLLGRGLGRMGAELLIFGYPTPERYDELADAILAKGVSSLVGPASAVAGAARRSVQTGRDRTLSEMVESVLLSAEYVSEQDRRDIGAIWRCRVNEHYGMTETGLGGAVGCTEPGGYHIWASNLYYEVIDPQTGRPLPPGEAGELAVTTLQREGMPLIRYRTGDVSRFLPGPCPCGSKLPRLERVRSRPQEKKFIPRTVPDTL